MKKLFEVFFEMQKTLVEMRDLMVEMEKHLKALTLPPNLMEWAKYKEGKRDT